MKGRNQAGQRRAMFAKQKVFELTTNERDGFAKWYVRGLKDEKEAKQLALKGFGRKYASKSLYGHYDDYPSKYGHNWKKESFTKESFIKAMKKEYPQKISQEKKSPLKFENMKDWAELKALSKYSLEHPLTDAQTKRMLELGRKLRVEGGKVPDIR